MTTWTYGFPTASTRALDIDSLVPGEVVEIDMYNAQMLNAQLGMRIRQPGPALVVWNIPVRRVLFLNEGNDRNSLPDVGLLMGDKLHVTDNENMNDVFKANAIGRNMAQGFYDRTTYKTMKITYRPPHKKLR